MKGMKRRKRYADGGLAESLRGSDRRRRLDEAEAASVGVAPAPAPVAAGGVIQRPVAPVENRMAGMENVGGVGVVSPPANRMMRDLQQDKLRQAGVLRRAHGGRVAGPGGPRDDKIPALLSNGEYVLPADTVQKVGANNLDKLRAATHKRLKRR